MVPGIAALQVALPHSPYGTNSEKGKGYEQEASGLKIPSTVFFFFKTTDSTESAFKMIQTAKEAPLTRKIIKVDAIYNSLSLKATQG